MTVGRWRHRAKPLPRNKPAAPYMAVSCMGATLRAHFAGRGFESRLLQAISYNSSILIIFA